MRGVPDEPKERLCRRLDFVRREQYLTTELFKVIKKGYLKETRPTTTSKERAKRCFGYSKVLIIKPKILDFVKTHFLCPLETLD